MDKKLMERAQARFEADKTKQAEFQKYDDMDNLVWSPPPGWVAKDWIRVAISSMAHDSLKTTANIFDTHNPTWHVQPRTNSDMDNAEEIETWIEYMTTRANLAGEVSPFRKAMHNSAKFNRVIFHVDYLPYWLPADKNKWSAEQKADSANGPYCIEAIDPRTLWYEVGKYGLKWVMNVANMSGQDIIDKWSIYESESKEGKQIAKGLEKIKSLIDDEKADKFIYVNLTSIEKRVCVAIPTTSDGIDEFCDYEFDNRKHITILDGENKLKFIPYAVATGDSDPLLSSALSGHIWENQNVIDSLVDSSKLRMAFIPPIIHKSDMVDKDVDVNFDGSSPSIELRAGETAQLANLPTIDPGLIQLSNINSQRMAQSVGIQNLAMNDIAGNVQFSTVQAQIQLQLTALQPYKRTTEKAMSKIPLIMFKWIEVTGKSEIGKRSAKRTRKPGQYEGQPITMSAETLDPDNMNITCELLSNSPTDKQQLVNMFSTMTQTGMMVSQEQMVEQLGYPNAPQEKIKWFDEQIQKLALAMFQKTEESKLQVEVQKQMAEIQAAVQAKIQAMQQPQMTPEQEQAAAAQGGATPPQGDMVSQGGQSQNPAMGGQPPIMATPGLTRNNVRNPG